MTRSERWRPVVGFEGTYEVSDFGRVRSVDRYVNNNGRRCFKVGVVRKLTLNTSGYPRLSLGAGRDTYEVHILVMRAFRGPCPAGQEVLHHNGRKPDCRLSNLFYGTRGDNLRDRKWHAGTSRYTLTGEQAAQIKRALRTAKWGDQTKIAKQYGVSDGIVSQIKLGRIHVDA